MSDLTDERLATIMEQTEQGAMHVRDILDVHHALRELEHRRAAQPADAERVRAVVRASVDAELDQRRFRTALGAERPVITQAIGDRVAAQLAPDRLLARVAELETQVARLRPVVAAADAWFDDPCKAFGTAASPRWESDLVEAVKAYRASRPHS